MQTRTMKDNLIIAGIPESVDENTETVIKTFINDVLKVPGDIPLHVVHDLCPYDARIWRLLSVGADLYVSAIYERREVEYHLELSKHHL
jgi:hypothetical protein